MNSDGKTLESGGFKQSWSDDGKPKNVLSTALPRILKHTSTEAQNDNKKASIHKLEEWLLASNVNMS